MTLSQCLNNYIEIANLEYTTAYGYSIIINYINKYGIPVPLEQIRRKARGEADAIYMRMEAEARGAQEMLIKQADGFAQVVSAAGSPSDALRLMLADKMETLMQIQVDAIKNIKIDKVTVWDGANGEKNATANFLAGMAKSIPPMQELFDMAGMQLPNYLGTPKAEEAAEPAPDAAE